MSQYKIYVLLSPFLDELRVSQSQPYVFLPILGHNHKHIILGTFFPGAKFDHRFKYSGEYSVGSKRHFQFSFLLKAVFSVLCFSNFLQGMFDLQYMEEKEKKLLLKW